MEPSGIQNKNYSSEEVVPGIISFPDRMKGDYSFFAMNEELFSAESTAPAPGTDGKPNP